MHVVVVGGGLIGVTTAWRLRRDGHEVTLIERNAGWARETSFANGGMLTPSMADPWNAPGIWRDLLRWIGRREAPMLLRLHALPALAPWGLKFVAASSAERFARNTLRNLRLAAHSVAGMEELRRDEPFDYAAGTRGTLKIYRDPRALEAGLQKLRELTPSVAARALDSREAVALEPGLAPIEASLAGAVHFPEDESGDARVFTERLADAAARRGVRIVLDASVQAISIERGRIQGVHTSTRERAQAIPADAVVVAAGCATPQLLRACGVRLPIYPVKGYSLTWSLPQDAGPGPLSIPVIDDALHAAITPLGNRLRIAGTAEFAGFDRTLDPSRLDNLRSLLRAVLPARAAQLLAAPCEPWAGLRPMSADGVPMIGACGPTGLYVNAGHGHLGWTMADGSARLLADLIAARQPELDPADYSPRRFE